MLRRFAVLLALLVVAPGCSGISPFDGPASPTTETTTPGSDGPPAPTSTPDTSTTATTREETEATTPAGHESLSKQPDPDHRVRLANRWNRSVEVRVRVVREATNETVHDATYDLPPDSGMTAYNLASAGPDGVESFRVAATARNETERVTLATNACYGGAYVDVQEDATLGVYYAIC